MISLWRWQHPPAQAANLDAQPDWEVTVWRPERRGVDLRVGPAWEVYPSEWTATLSLLVCSVSVWRRRPTPHRYRVQLPATRRRRR